jgi:acyl-CoA synthetase (NDP forming)
LRAANVPAVVADCVRQGIASIVVCSSGFGELGVDGRGAQADLRDIARAGGSRILGPNCIGVANVAGNVIACPTLNLTGRLTPGGISIVSQSGGMGVNVLNRAQGRGIGVRVMISSGNECDLECAELVDALIADEQTASIALVLEQLRDGPRFVAAAQRAREAGKPLVVLKMGKSEVGRRSAQGHTGAMAGDYAVFRDVLSQLGVLEVDTVDELLDAAHILATSPAPTGPRLLAVSPSGGECSYVADRAVSRGLVLPELPAALEAALAPHMPLGLPGNPLDPTGQIIGEGDLLDRMLALVTSDDAFDMISFAIPTWGSFDSQRLLPRFVRAAQHANKPIALSAWSAADLTETADEVLRDSGVPNFPSADQGVDALSNLYRYHAARAWRPAAGGEPLARPAGLGEAPGEYQTKQLLQGWSIPTSDELLTVDVDVDAALTFAADIGWPVVAKLQCQGLHHKSELGLVRTSIGSAPQLRQVLIEFDAVAAAEALTPEGYLICRQVAGVELIVGAIRDPCFGPVVMVGAGGVLAEHFVDRVFRLCPLTVEDAVSAIESLRIGGVLGGARGRVFDVKAAAEVLARVSEVFARADWIRELDLNPVIVHEQAGGATVVDAVLIPQDVISFA